ncbi:WAP four-disulfide core domain protein 1-like isoform X2 [Saccostrea echinata]|uniref:WAP four-disulfide core domain protein 1-like isoform X2 n=1 Tax=Saccostrea echinata TaxID=191078 RepID=UPI002A83EFA8|nr:WAP four-disulfide core domain protein 1-like isoform X2 [Saccostrea echinata]
MRKMFTFKQFNLICIVIWNCLTFSSAKSVEDVLIPREKTRWLSDELNYDDYDYNKDEPQNLALSDDDSECGPVPDIVLTGFCKKKTCSSHTDCRKKNQRCCFNGCVKTCMRQPDPPPFIDWIKEPRSRIVSGVSWLINGPSNRNELQTCTTSPFGKNEDPLMCPHGYTCHVVIKGNKKKRIQNRGYCVPEKENVVRSHRKQNNRSTVTGECPLDKYILAEGAFMLFDGKKCFCKKGFLECLEMKG